MYTQCAKTINRYGIGFRVYKPHGEPVKQRAHDNACICFRKVSKNVHTYAHINSFIRAVVGCLRWPKAVMIPE